MANAKISALPTATELQGSELIATVQNGDTKQTTVSKFKNYFVSTSITAQDTDNIDLSSSIYDNTFLFKISWSGGNGLAICNLPSAVLNANRMIRFISDGTFEAADHFDITPSGGQTLDGSSNAYRINKSYEGVAIWSDGVEWFVIQKKA
jgi:hypothetical protein